jgi:hypothetical protein
MELEQTIKEMESKEKKNTSSLPQENYSQEQGFSKEIVTTLIQVLEEIKEGNMSLEDLKHLQEKEASSSERAEGKEESLESWNFSEETGKYHSTLEFDQWGDLDSLDLLNHKDLEWSINQNEKDLSVDLTTSSKEVAKEFEEKFRTIQNFQEEERSDETVQKYEAVKTEADTSVLKDNFSQGSVSCFEQDNKHFVKIPIATVGEWHHPQYGKVEFTQEKLEEIKANIESNELGWEPPLFYGHPTDGGASSKGFLEKIFVEEDTLFGIWAVSKTVYDQVQNDEFRYSSSEFITNFTSKRTGKEIGNVLIGMALTNRPFIPDLPRNVALEEEGTIYKFSTELTFQETADSKLSTAPDLGEVEDNEDSVQDKKQETTMTQNSLDQKQEEQLRAELEEHKNKLKEYQEQLDKYSNELETVKQTYENQLNQATEEIKELRGRIRQSEVDNQIDRLDQLKGIPEKQVEEYKEMVRNGSLGSSEEHVIRSLEEMSQSFSTEVFEQNGQTNSVVEENAPSNSKKGPEGQKSLLEDSPHFEKYQENKEKAKQKNL